MSEEAGASWDRVSANYLQNFGIALFAAGTLPPATTRLRSRLRWSTKPL